MDENNQQEEKACDYHEEKSPLMQATSFAELETIEAADEMLDNLRSNAQKAFSMMVNIMAIPDLSVDEKLNKVSSLMDEFKARVIEKPEAEMKEKQDENILNRIVSMLSSLMPKVDTKDDTCECEQSTEEVKAAPMKTEDGIKYPKSDYAYTPSDKPSTWKLRMSPPGKPGTRSVKMLGAAASGFSVGGHRGKPVQIPAKDVAKVKAKLRAEYKKLDAEPPPSIKEVTKEKFSLYLDKETNRLRWLATYTNNIRDNDNPPEILTKQAHYDFVDRVNNKEVDYPELWIWHNPNWNIGTTDILSLDEYEDVVFVVASGSITPGLEKAAEAIFGNLELAVSHGMPADSIERCTEDNSLITRYDTREISPLPRGREANPFTTTFIGG